MRQMNGGTNSRIPLWLKIAWTALVVVWAPLYWRQYGAQNFLFFCDLGNFLILAGLWMQSQLIISWQAVGLLVFQTAYAVDLLGALLSGKHLIGGTEYMFDPAIPILARMLGLYHLIVPALLLWAVRRLGYDESAWKWQVLLTCVLVPLNHFWRAEYDVNWASGIGHAQHVMPGWLYLIGYLFVAPVAVYWPTHLGLKWWSSVKR